MAKNKAKIPLIKHESKITTEINGLYYARMQDVYAAFAAKIGQENVKDYLLAISKNAIGTLPEKNRPDAFAMETILMFLGTVEKEFSDAGLIEEQEIELPSED